MGIRERQDINKGTVWDKSFMKEHMLEGCGGEGSSKWVKNTLLDEEADR